MKRTIYLIAISLITILCVGYAVTRDYGFGFGFRDDDWESSGGSYDVVGRFDRVVINADAMEIVVKKNNTDEYAVKCSFSKKFQPDYHNENGVLYINQNIKLRSIRKAKCNITILVPNSASLEKFNADLDLGSIRISDVDVRDYDISAALGDVRLTDTDFDKAVIHANLGDIAVKNCSFTRLDIDENLGDVSVDCREDISGYTFDLNIDLGEISVNGKDYMRNYYREGSKGEIRIDNNLGDISVKY